MRVGLSPGRPLIELVRVTACEARRGWPKNDRRTVLEVHLDLEFAPL